MSSAKFENLAKLMTSYSFDFIDLPDTLKCAKCKLVLKDACQVPCGCIFCRVCINDMMESGGQFCPGLSEECGESLLSLSLSDYRANKSVSRLIVKCVHVGCAHQCQLANIEEHLRECQRKYVECPFRELGCTQDKLVAEEIDGHLQHENRKHCEILSGVVANIDKEIGTVKQELVMKDEQISTILDRMIHVENENKSISRENTDIADRVRLLTGQIERKINERRENDEINIAAVIEHVGREIAVIKAVVRTNKDELASQIKSILDDIQSINQGIKSMKDDICFIKSHVQSIRVDERFEWQININIEQTRVGWPGKTSDYYTGKVSPYKYRLASLNNIYTARDSLVMVLRIYLTERDTDQLVWPFEGLVIMTVTDKNKPEACRRISLQCRIKRPSNNDYSISEQFEFIHSELREAGLDLCQGVHVLCEIVLGAGQ